MCCACVWDKSWLWDRRTSLGDPRPALQRCVYRHCLCKGLENCQHELRSVTVSLNGAPIALCNQYLMWMMRVL